MSDEQYLDSMKEHLEAGDTVYALVKKKKRSWWREFLDSVVSWGVLTAASDIKNLLDEKHFLIARESSGEVITLNSAQEVVAMPVPGWRPEWKANFKKCQVGEFIYQRTGVIRK